MDEELSHIAAKDAGTIMNLVNLIGLVIPPTALLFKAPRDQARRAQAELSRDLLDSLQHHGLSAGSRDEAASCASRNSRSGTGFSRNLPPCLRRKIRCDG